MALGQYSEHGDHSLSPFEPGVCIGFRTLTLSVRKHAMSLGQNSEHLDHSASPLEPAACAVLVFLLPGVHHKRTPVQHGSHSPCRPDQSSVQYSMALQHAGATRSSSLRKWKRAHSGNAFSKYKPDLLYNATREEISREKPLLPSHRSLHRSRAWLASSAHRRYSKAMRRLAAESANSSAEQPAECRSTDTADNDELDHFASDDDASLRFTIFDDADEPIDHGPGAWDSMPDDWDTSLKHVPAAPEGVGMIWHRYLDPDFKQEWFSCATQPELWCYATDVVLDDKNYFSFQGRWQQVVIPPCPGSDVPTEDTSSAAQPASDSAVAQTAEPSDVNLRKLLNPFGSLNHAEPCDVKEDEAAAYWKKLEDAMADLSRRICEVERAALSSCRCGQDCVPTKNARECPSKSADDEVEASPTHGQMLQEHVNEASKRVLILEEALLRSCT